MMKSRPEKLPAVILAAGEGSRLQQEEEHAPLKPLTPLLGLTILERTLLTCRGAGVGEFLIVVGYRKEELIPCIEELKKKYDLTIRVVENPAWEAGNGTSVLACAPYLSGPFLLMMCDHLFEPEILEELVKADDGEEVCLLAVDRNIEELFDPEDATLVRLEQNQVTAIGKELENSDAVDTGFFLCRPTLFSALEKSIQEGDGSLSGGIRRLTDSGRVRAVDVSERFWHDVDTPEALRTGEKRLISKLKTAKRIDGPVSRYLNRFFSLKLTRRLAGYKITPNQVTAAGTLTGMLGALFFFVAGASAAGSPGWIWPLMALAGLFIQISSILDGVDGEIARLKYHVSPYRAYFDCILDRYVEGLAVMGMVYASYMINGNLSVIIMGLIALLGMPLSSIHRAKFLAEAGRNYLSKDDGPLRFVPYSRDVRLFAIFLGGIFNTPEAAIYFLAIVPNSVALLRLITVRRAMKKAGA